MEELHLNDPDRNPTSSEYFLDRLVAKERIWFDTDGAIIEHRGNSREAVKIQTNPVHNYSEVILIDERKWNDTLACQNSKGHTCEAEVSIGHEIGTSL